MPVSHLGLTVSHIPSATSFYLGALQPLGYRYIGCQGDSVGLGIDDADFFITQGPRSSYIAPTHIAFAADDRTQVRNCYTSALSAGGRPSGPPGYRNHECSCFNAAVEDLDGNTIEFIFRENGPCDAKPSHADEEKSRVLTWQEGVSKEADAASVASKAESKAPTEAPSEKAPSEKAPTVAEPEPAAEPAPASDGGILSALSSGITGKNVLGGVIGAVAVGAVGYAFYRSEQDSARAEAAHEALMASYERGRVPSARPPAYAPGMKRSMSAAAPRTARTFRNYAPTESIGPDPRQHRNFSVTESRVGPRPPPTQVPTQAPTAMKAIEARAYDRDSEIQSVLSKHTSRYPRTEYRALEAPGDYYDDDEIQTVLSRHTSRHPEEMRAIEAGSKAPTMVSRRTSHRALEGARSEAPTMMSRRSSHAPQEPRAIEAARSEAPTMASRRSSHAPQGSRALEDARSEAPTTLSKQTSRRSQALRALDADSEVQAATSRMTNRRPQVARSQTFDASVYSPMPSSVGSAGTLPTRAPPKRSATLHDDPTAHSRLYLEGPKELVPSSKSLRSGRDEHSEAGRSEGGASKVSHRSSRRDVKDDDEKSQASTVRHIKPDGSRYEGPRHEGSRYEGSKHGSSRHEGSAHESKHEGSEHGRSRHEGSRHGSSHNDGASRNGLSRDPDGLSDASTIKASRRDSAAHIPSPASKAASKVSRATAAEYRLPDSPVPSYYYPPSEAPKPVAREPVQPSPMQNGPQAFRPASHQTVLQPTQAQAVYAPPPAARRASHASGSAAGVPLPSSLASGRGYEDVEDSDGLGDIKTVVPDDSISCIDLSKPKAPRSDVSRQSERSHRSHRTHHTSRSKHSHRHDDEKSRVAIDAQTVVPEDSISSVGSKPARSEHSHHTHRSSRDDKKSHHSSRSKHSKSHEKEEEKETDDATVYLDARTVLPEDSISSVGAPARSEHSHHSHRSSRDDKKSHHSSRSKHSKSHDEDKDKKHRKEGRTESEAGRSDVTVKPAKAKSLLSAMTLPGRLKGDKEEKKKRSVASYA